MTLQPRLKLASSEVAFSRPVHRQLAALCWRSVSGKGASGKGASGSGREVLLVTSSTGRWILPKGWPINGKSPAEAAMTEAWEEGGVKKGKVSRRPLGSYMATKLTLRGDEEPCLLLVYAIKVRKTVDDFPEAAVRERLWVCPRIAATLVHEDGLREILREF